MTTVDYDPIAPSYDLRYAEHDYSGVERTLRDFVKERRDVLEVGCGTGHWLGFLTGQRTSPVGLDASRGMLTVAAQRQTGIPLAQGSAESLPFHDASFDAIIAINALHHFPGPERFIRECRRVLRPGGGLLTVGLDPSGGQDEWFVYDYFPGTLDSDRDRYPNRRVISNWLSLAGFEDVGSFPAQRWQNSTDARAYLERGGAAKDTCSQFVVLSTEAYEAGLARVRTEAHEAEARGATLRLRGELTLHATVGIAPK